MNRCVDRRSGTLQLARTCGPRDNAIDDEPSNRFVAVVIAVFLLVGFACIRAHPFLVAEP